MNDNTQITSYPTAGQLERIISQQVRALYRQQFGHQPSKVECHLMGNKIILSLEDVITPLEKLLVEAQSSNLVIQIRSFIDDTIKPKLQQLIEEVSKVNVINCLYDTEINSGCAGAIVILANPPKVRPSRSTAKRNKNS